MPVYEVSHIIPLNESQRDALATAITRIHTELFTAPALFVNIHFTDGSSKVAYVGGKRVSTCRDLLDFPSSLLATAFVFKMSPRGE